MATWLAVLVAAASGGLVCTVLMGAITAGKMQDLETAVRRAEEHAASLLAHQGEAVEQERKLTARWRDRALLCEEQGPTVGEVEEVFRENVRLRLELDVAHQKLGIQPRNGE